MAAPGEAYPRVLSRASGHSRLLLTGVIRLIDFADSRRAGTANAMAVCRLSVRRSLIRGHLYAAK